MQAYIGIYWIRCFTKFQFRIISSYIYHFPHKTYFESHIVFRGNSSPVLGVFYSCTWFIRTISLHGHTPHLCQRHLALQVQQMRLRNARGHSHPSGRTSASLESTGVCSWEVAPLKGYTVYLVGTTSPSIPYIIVMCEGFIKPICLMHTIQMFALLQRYSKFAQYNMHCHRLQLPKCFKHFTWGSSILPEI